TIRRRRRSGCNSRSAESTGGGVPRVTDGTAILPGTTLNGSVGEEAVCPAKVCGLNTIPAYLWQTQVRKCPMPQWIFYSIFPRWPCAGSRFQHQRSILTPRSCYCKDAPQNPLPPPVPLLPRPTAQDASPLLIRQT